MYLTRSFTLAVGLLLIDPASAQLRLPSTLVHLPSSSCNWLSATVPAEAVYVNKHEISTSPTGAVQIRMLQGGSRILLAVSEFDSSDSLDISVFAKYSDSDHEFYEVCTHKLLHGEMLKKVLAIQAPLESSNVLWRVEIVATRRRGIQQSPPILWSWDGSTTDGRAVYVQETPLQGMLCLEGIPEMDQEHLAAHRFGGRTSLEVNAEQTSYKLSSKQYTTLVNAILDSAALWVRACIACRVEHLVVVSVDGKLYTRPVVNEWLDSLLAAAALGQPVPPASDQEKSLVHMLQPVQMLMAGERLHNAPTGKQLDRYSPMPDKNKEILCSLHTSFEKSPTSDSLRRAVCGESDNMRDVSRIRLRFRDGPTACGDDLNVIACRSDLELTEYNARDYRFISQDPSQESLGEGSIDVDLDQVVAHEMGHWIGLGHIDDSGQSLMASSMDSSRCIDMETVKHLLELGDSATPMNSPQAFTMKRNKGGR